MKASYARALLILGDGLSPSLESPHISPKKGLNLRDKPSKSPPFSKFCGKLDPIQNILSSHHTNIPRFHHDQNMNMNRIVCIFRLDSFRALGAPSIEDRTNWKADHFPHYRARLMKRNERCIFRLHCMLLLLHTQGIPRDADSRGNGRQ